MPRSSYWPSYICHHLSSGHSSGDGFSVAGHIGFCFLRTDCLTALYISCRTGVVTCSNLCVNFAVADFAAGDEIIGLGDEGVHLTNSYRWHQTSFFSGVEILEMRFLID